MSSRVRFAYSFLFSASFMIAFGCSSSDKPTVDGAGDGGGASAAPSSSSGSQNQSPNTTSDSGTSSTSDSGTKTSGDGSASTCPPPSGNAQGIGATCTKGGKECDKYSLSCDIDLDPKGKGICISFLKCTPGHGDCGTGATCCQTADTQFVAVCLPNACLVDGCNPE